MLIIRETLVTEDIIEKHFVCHLEKCKGACCEIGDRGAPLVEDEIPIIEKDLDKIKGYMDRDGLNLLSDKGFHEIDPDDGELVTTCRPNGACVFVVYENGATQCSIEKAFLARETDFKKPMSCHLYPIRASKYGDYTVLNYHKWEICKAACSFGESLEVPLFRFLKEPLIRKLGEDWYAEIEEIAENWEQKG